MADLTDILRELSASDDKRRWQARHDLWETVADAGSPTPSRPTDAIALELLAWIERPSESPAVRALLVSAVATLGVDELVVPRLIALLSDESLQDAVRGALETIGGDAARNALAQLLRSSATLELRIAVAAALGSIQDDASRSLLAALSDANIEIRLAAAESLSRYPYAELDRVLAAVPIDGSDAAEARIQRARLRLAKVLSRNGQAIMAYRVRREIARVAKKPWILRDAERDLR